MMRAYYSQKGYTLLATIFIVVLVGVFFTVFYVANNIKTQQNQIDKALAEMQQILTAGLSYYVISGQGTWPVATGTSVALKSSVLVPNYVPPRILNPWGFDYTIAASAATQSIGAHGDQSLFYVYTKIDAGSLSSGIANAVAGRLPNGYVSKNTAAAIPPNPAEVCTPADTACYVVGSVTIPGYNLSNANSVNYSGIYHHGACVPAPDCPKKTWPQIMVAPVSVTGVNDPGSTTAYPISSFTAYATNDNGILDKSPLACNINGVAGAPTICPNIPASSLVVGYWRVCLQVITAKGDVSQTNNTLWGNKVSIVAITRCGFEGEQLGSPFDVFTQ